MTSNHTENTDNALVKQVISDELLKVLKTINYAVLCQVVDVFGTVSNIINMIVFLRIGFSDTINISLFGLAFSDFGACLTLIWQTICRNPWFEELDLPFDTTDIVYLTSTWPHVMFARVTTLITAFITFERCLCVTMPLKVKSVITTRTVKVFTVCTYFVVIASSLPIYYTNRYAWKFYPHRNESLIGLVFTNDRMEIESVYYPVLNVFFSILSFLAIMVCTSILVVSLRSKMKWKMTATASKTNEVSSKENKVVRMVILLSSLFILCFFPNVVVMMVMMVDRDISIDGKNSNLLIVFGSFIFLLESINSASNVFIYYFNSSNYREMFRQIFLRGDSSK